MTTIYSKVSDLPASVRDVLHREGYRRADVGVRVAETESLSCAGGDGYRTTTIVLNLATGESETLQGSWGGSNMFTPENRVDNDTRSRVLGRDVAVLKVTEGGGRPVSARITIGPSNVIAALPAKPALTLGQRQILDRYRAYKSSYRKEELERARIANVDDVTRTLVDAGLLKKSGAGLALTTDGRNAVADVLSMPRDAAVTE